MTDAIKAEQRVRERAGAEVSIVLLKIGTQSTSLILRCAHVVLPRPSQYACKCVSQRGTAAPVHPHSEGPGAYMLSYALACYSTCIVREGQQVGSDANEETLKGRGRVSLYRQLRHTQNVS